MQAPRIIPPGENLEEWRGTMLRALETMTEHARTGNLIDDTLERDYDFLRHLMGRRILIRDEIMRLRGPHRGPGTAGYEELGNRGQGTGNRNSG